MSAHRGDRPSADADVADQTAAKRRRVRVALIIAAVVAAVSIGVTVAGLLTLSSVFDDRCSSADDLQLLGHESIEAVRPAGVTLAAPPGDDGCGFEQRERPARRSWVFQADSAAATADATQALGVAAVDDGWNRLAGSDGSIQSFTKRIDGRDVVLDIVDMARLLGPGPDRTGSTTFDVLVSTEFTSVG